jgi:hypothetical protein
VLDKLLLARFGDTVLLVDSVQVLFPLSRVLFVLSFVLISDITHQFDGVEARDIR